MDVDGVIMLDLEMVRYLVDGLGGLALPDNRTVTGDTVIPYFYESWARPRGSDAQSQVNTPRWWLQRKNFMRDVVQAALGRIQGHPSDIPVVRLARNVVRGLQERHLLLIPLRDPTSQGIVARQGWDGAVRPGDGDYLRVTDTNVGFNKTNAKVDLEMAYTVDLRATPATATLMLTYTHRSRVAIPTCIQEARYGERYEDMQDRCYWNYLRVNRPGGTRLVRAEGLRPDTITTGAGDRETTEIAGLMVLPPGRQHVVTIQDRLPDLNSEAPGYHLRVQKQPGQRTVPLTLHIYTRHGDVTRRLLLNTDLDVHLIPEGPALEVRPTYPRGNAHTHSCGGSP
ncbi:MAG: hypothetical protein GXP47_09490 [Acidobacteria bacterium]|nr:hypothetical protein [Acidobacteriota bacterium]